MSLNNYVKSARIAKSYPAYIGRSLFSNSSFAGAKAYNDLCSLVNFREAKKRRKLWKEISSLDTRNEIDPERGFLVSDYSDSEGFKRAFESANNIARNLPLEEQAKNAKKSFLLNHNLPFSDIMNENILQFATSTEMLAPISKYLGDLPVLTSMSIWYSPNENPDIRGSQLYHIDAAAYRQMKCFIPLEEVTKESGPLFIVPAKESKAAFDKLKQEGRIKGRGDKVSDETVYNKVGKDTAVCLETKPGSVVFADTSNCFHYGSRLGSKPRLQLSLQYFSAFASSMPIYGRDYEDYPQPTSSNVSKELFRAVTGLAHLNFSTVRTNRGD